METGRRQVLIESLRLRRRADWAAALGSGLAAGAAMGLIVVLTRDGAGRADLERRVAALILGPGVLPPPQVFDLAIALVAWLAHAFLSAALALPLADAVFKLERKPALALGGLYGLLLYGLDLHVYTRLFPWFVPLRGPGALGLHILYGVVAALVYGRLERERLLGYGVRRRRRPARSRAILARWVGVI